MEWLSISPSLSPNTKHWNWAEPRPISATFPSSDMPPCNSPIKYLVKAQILPKSKSRWVQALQLNFLLSQSIKQQNKKTDLVLKTISTELLRCSVLSEEDWSQDSSSNEEDCVDSKRSTRKHIQNALTHGKLNLLKNRKKSNLWSISAGSSNSDAGPVLWERDHKNEYQVSSLPPNPYCVPTCPKLDKQCLGHHCQVW